MRGGSLKLGGWITTPCVRTAVWGIGHRKNSRPKSPRPASPPTPVGVTNPKMNSSLILALSTATLLAAGTTKTASGPASRPLSAPTYYISIRVHNCGPNAVKFDGASNLPQGARVALKVGEPYQDALKDYSDNVYVPVDSRGFFEGVVSPKKGISFEPRAILVANFTTYEPKQSQSVLQVVGKIGENLGGLENPQVQYLSGNYQILRAIDITPFCGKGVTEPAN